MSKKPTQSERPTQRSAGPTLSNEVQELVTQSYNSSKDDFSGETPLNGKLVRKPVFGISDQVRHKLNCTATANGQKLEFLDL